MKEAIALALSKLKIGSLLAKLPGLGKILGWLGIGAGKIGTAAATVAGIYAVAIVGLHLLTSLLLIIASALIAVAFEFNNNIVSAVFVKDGYKIILGVANMGFIAALVVIAFGTMFRSDAFGYKKALPKLIIAALLINFSFFIITNGFIKPIAAITNSIWQAADFNGTFGSAEAIFDPRGAASDALGDIDIPNIDVPGIPDAIVNGIGKLVAGSLLGIAFAFISVIALFAFAFMLFVRGIALAFLIILMPLAWFGLIFPNLKVPGGGNPWKMWWESFIRWLLFAPFAIFFFFLAIGVANSGASDLVPDTGNNLITGIGQMMVVIGLMIGGLMVANKMGIAGSGYAIAVASKGKVWAQGKVKQYGARTREVTLRNKYSDKAITKLQDLGKGWKFGGRQLTAPIRGAGRGAATAAFRAERAVDEATMKKFEGLPPYAIRRMRDGLKERQRYVADLVMAKAKYDWEDTPMAAADWAKWEKEGRFDPKKGGNPILSLELLDRGVSTEVLAAEADMMDTMTGIVGRTDPKAAKELRGQSLNEVGDWFQTNKPKLNWEEVANLAGLEKALDKAWDKAINLIGYRGLANINHRLASDPGAYQPWRSSQFHNWNRQQLIDRGLDKATGAVGSLQARSRADAATFITERVRLKNIQMDKDYIEPIADTIRGGIESDIQGIETSRRAGEITEEVATQRTAAKQNELARINNLSLATPADKDQWLQRHWNELVQVAPKREAILEARLTAEQIAAKFNQLAAVGKKAYFIPFAAGETAGAPPPAV